jgi:hypothetical protein
MPDPAIIPTAAPPSPAIAPGGPAALGPKPPPNPLAPPTPQLGAAVSPQGNPGLAVKAMGDVRNAVQMLEAALPHIPMGSELHVEVLNSVKALTKHLSSGGEQNKGLDLMSLLAMARNASQAQPMQALNRAFPTNPGGPPAMGPPSAPPMASAA